MYSKISRHCRKFLVRIVFQVYYNHLRENFFYTLLISTKFVLLFDGPLESPLIILKWRQHLKSSDLLLDFTTIHDSYTKHTPLQ